jgi:anti-sigma regulatory factor (Ser/Thr protein kinase)
MTNRLAVILAVLIAGGLVLDMTMGWGLGLFLARRFADLVEWMAFWR